MTSENNRVWIEIENPKHDDHKTGHERAEKMSALLKKLNPKWGKNFNPIFWHENKNRYCYQSCPGDGFLTLENSGHWFNLDYLSK